MFGDHFVTWLWLLLLGAVHGVNPGMGWLFAVALGLQERSARAVWRALGPLAVGHALAIAAAILLAGTLGLVMAPGQLKWVVALALFAVGAHRLVRHRHPRWGGMQVGMRDLVVWSLLMASAHGAGLMVLPVLLSGESEKLETVHAESSQQPAAGHVEHCAGDDAAHAHAMNAPSSTGRISGVAAALVHTLGYLVVTGFMAVLVYFWAGLRLLRAAWINIDVIWAFALIATALLTPVL